jgi:uncharacterized Rmd1/YagE family protein
LAARALLVGQRIDLQALGLLQARRSHRVEWYIVILIVFEIMLTLYQLTFLGGH